MNTRRKIPNTEPNHVQEYDLDLGMDISPEKLTQSSNHDIYVALYKYMKECIKHHLYLISQFMSYDKC